MAIYSYFIDNYNKDNIFVVHFQEFLNLKIKNPFIFISFNKKAHKKMCSCQKDFLGYISHFYG